MTRARTLAGAASLAAAALAIFASRGSRAEAGPASWLAADRDAGVVLELDADLFVLRRLALPWPLAARSAPRAGVWVLSAPAGHARSPRRLVLLDRRGRAGPALDVHEVLDLEVDGRGRALALVSDVGGARRLLRADGSGRVEGRVLPPEASAIAAGAEDAVLVAAGARGLLRVGGGARLRVDPAPGCRALDVARAPGGDWWLLCACEEGATLARLDAELRPRWERACGGLRLVASHSEADSVWVLDAAHGLAWALGGAGELLAGPHEVSGAPLVAAATGPAGELVAASAGALLRLSPQGAARPGQGRLERLADVAPRLPGD